MRAEAVMCFNACLPISVK